MAWLFTSESMKYFLVILAVFILLAASLQWSRSWERGFFLDPLSRLETDELVVALTFDDGPSEARTPGLLALLDEYDVPASFFMLGQHVEEYPEIARQVFDEGHLIGNHSYDHSRLILKTPSFVREQIESTDAAIQSLGQQEVAYFRPPYSSKYLVLPWLLKGMGKTLVTGTYDPPAEYQDPMDPELVSSQVLEHLEPGMIVYLHDGKESGAEDFLQSVRMIIEGARTAGYRFVRLDQPL